MMKKIHYYIMLCICFLAIALQPIATLSASETTSSKIAEIKKAGQLVVGVSADYRPYEFHTTIDGEDKIVGLDIGIAQAIADELGVKLVMRDMAFSGLLAALQSGTVDIVLSGMQETEERKQSVDFSIPYFTEKNVLVTKAENLDVYNAKQTLAGEKIGVQQGSTQERAAEALQAEVPELKIERLTNVLDIIQQIKDGRLAGMIVGDIVAEELLKHTTELAVDTAIAITHDDAGASVAVAKGNSEFIAVINKVIQQLIDQNQIAVFKAEALSYDEVSSDNNAGPFAFLNTYWPMLLQGALTTIIIAFFSVILGSIGGTLLAMMSLSDNKFFHFLATAYVDFIRGTPLLIQIYIIFYGLPSLGLRLPALVAGILAMSLNSTAYVAEIIRAGILAVDKGQFEAAASLGMKRPLMMKEIILPQAIKNILPALGNEFVTIIKESSILSVISVADLMFVANMIRGNTFQAFTPLIIVALLYFVLTFTLSKGLKLLERRLARNA